MTDLIRFVRFLGFRNLNAASRATMLVSDPGMTSCLLGDLAFETARSYRIAAEQLLRRILKPPILSSRPQGTNIHQNISGVIGQVGQVLRSTE